MLIANLSTCELLLLLPFHKIVLDQLMVSGLETVDLFKLFKILEVKFGLIFKPVNVFENEVIGNRDWGHDCVQHSVQPIIRSHNGFQVLGFSIFGKLILIVIDNR